jgi:hypothetical protein
MEDWKLQQLHDTLAKLRPSGNHGGLGVRSQTIGIGHKHKDNGLPKNGQLLIAALRLPSECIACFVHIRGLFATGKDGPACVARSIEPSFLVKA